jgi:hypothetical protein
MAPIAEAAWAKLHNPNSYTAEEKEALLKKTCRRQLNKINAQLHSLSTKDTETQNKKVTDFLSQIVTRLAFLRTAIADCQRLKTALCIDVITGVAWMRIFRAIEEPVAEDEGPLAPPADPSDVDAAETAAEPGPRLATTEDGDPNDGDLDIDVAAKGRFATKDDVSEAALKRINAQCYIESFLQEGLLSGLRQRKISAFRARRKPWSHIADFREVPPRDGWWWH